jgi:hypothetical protein
VHGLQHMLQFIMNKNKSLLYPAARLSPGIHD